MARQRPRRRPEWQREVVLLLGPREVEALLADGQPSLAFFAAWAVAHRSGPSAARVVERALEITDRLPSAVLRREQASDIMGVLSGRLMDRLKETMMEPRKRIESNIGRDWSQIDRD